MKEIILDTETTGLSAKDGHRIVEIGCIELDNLIPTKNKYKAKKTPKILMIVFKFSFISFLYIYILN